MSLRMDSKLVANLGTWRTFLRMRVRWRFPMLAMIIRDLSVVTIFLLLGQGEYVEKISDELTMCSISWILDLKVEKIVIWGIYFRKKGNSLECARDHEARDGCTFSTSSRMRWLCSSVVLFYLAAQLWHEHELHLGCSPFLPHSWFCGMPWNFQDLSWVWRVFLE